MYNQSFLIMNALYFMRSFITCTLHQILLGRSDWGWDWRGM